MCCCIPLRRLSYFGAVLHMIFGLFYFYFLGSVVTTMYKMRENKKSNYDERLRMGIMYVIYYAAFLPPGIFIFWGVHKKLRCFLVVPTIIFFFIQIYGVTLEGIYKFRPQDFPEAMEKYNDEGTILARLQVDYWMDMAIQLTNTLTYCFMLFFYYREIGPEASPVQSRYAQAYLQQVQNAEERQRQSSRAAGPPPVPFRPVSMSHHVPGSQLHTRTSTPCPPGHGQGLNMNLANLSYEQQQQLLKLQQHPLILQQFEQQMASVDNLMRHQRHHYQHGHGSDPRGESAASHRSHGHSHGHHDQEGTPLSMFHPYVGMQLEGGPKTPKF